MQTNEIQSFVPAPHGRPLISAKTLVGLFVSSLFLTSLIAFPASLRADTPATVTAQTSQKPDADTEPYADDDEVKLGRDNAQENDKQVKLVTDPAMNERVNRIGQEIAAVANKLQIQPTWGINQRKRFRYSFKVVNDKDTNAYSLPGGFIYVNKGLLDYVRSDDELAGVLAHEITHASHHHMMKLLREQKKLNGAMLPIIAAALLAGRGDMAATSQVFLFSQLYTIARVNSYGQEAEKDADHGGLLLLTHTRYNPVGLYSFMLRLAADERQHVMGDLGIYRTHPPSPERAASAKSLLEELKIPIRLSDVDPTLLPVVKSVKTGNGQDIAELNLRGHYLFRVTAQDGDTAEQRARRIGMKIASLLDARLQPFEIKVSRDQTRILARGQAILTDADATAQNRTLAEIATDISNAISQINQKQQLDAPL